MPDYEKLGAFYLGRLYDLQRKTTEPGLLLYESKDLTTHAVCVGMTGSGKTGLCVSLLEEAAIDGVPVIAIDPKGDLGNLLLAFPHLEPADFRPWVDEGEAARNGMTQEQYATLIARRWREGLASWDQDAERVARFRGAADAAIYTPGSSAGLQLSVLQSFAAPSDELLRDDDALRDRVEGAASGLLALMGIEADSLHCREQILLANLLQLAWREGRSLTIADLIRGIQTPPLTQLGYLDLETVFPSRDRLELAMRLNNLVASPTFASWLRGDPLDIKRLLYSVSGQPRLSIVSIAHLSDAERMFFVTLLLNEVLAWVRTQSGTSSLRAILYMDEVFGYFPPTSNPPSKRPMLTLLKQARAYGLGIVLATQNPVDLDYKGLSNTGTWFLGRLQTQRDKARVMEGLEGAAATTGATFNRQQVESTLSGLTSRVFLMNNVHDDGPTVFQTRWALSYLRGPLTRKQIQELMAPRKRAKETGDSTESGNRFARADRRGATTASPGQPPVDAPEPSIQAERPIVPQEAGERFVVADLPRPAGARLCYRPALLGSARLHFVRASYRVDYWHNILQLCYLDVLFEKHHTESLWGDSFAVASRPRTDQLPCPDGEFSQCPPAVTRATNYQAWGRQLREYLYRERTLTVWRCPSLKVHSQPPEAEDDFRIRLAVAAREQRDLQIEKIRQRYARRLAALHDRIRRAEERVDRERAQYEQQQYQTAVTFGTSLVGALFGRKLASRTNVGRAGSAMRAAGRSAHQRRDIERAQESVDALREQLAELEQTMQEDIEQMEESLRPDQIELDRLQLRPRKSDIGIERVVLLWVPWYVESTGKTRPAATSCAPR